ncbi:MAG: hypothetical protein V3U35_00780 [Candidatus Neomarinimicrobiota bacterium]
MAAVQITKEQSCQHIVGQYTIYPLMVLEASLRSGRLSETQRHALHTRRDQLKTRQPDNLPDFREWCERLAQHLNETSEDHMAWVRYGRRSNGTWVCCVMDESN